MTGKTDYKLGELSQAMKDVGRELGEIKDFMSKYDQRISSLEQSRSQANGGIAIISAFTSFLMMVLAAVINKFIGGIR